MTLQDPSDLLQRIPELAPLATDDRIRRAIAGGDPFKVYRALVWAKWLRRLPQHSSTLDALIRQRRLFAKPLKGMPSLGSVNTIGFGFVGSDERDGDGTYVALYALVVLFALPLLPLGSYLVQSAGRSGLSSQWRIFARVPMGTPAWLYTRGLAVAALGLMAFAGYSAYHASGHQEVMVFNGFGKPLQVELQGRKLSLAPQAHAQVDLVTGKLDGVARLADGTEVDRLAEDLHADADYAIWNIGGVAPLYLETVIYSADGTPKPADSEIPAPAVHCGDHFFEAGGVDYAFVDPPERLTMNKGQDRMSRTHLAVAKAEQGIKPDEMCMMYASGQPSLGRFGGMFASIAAANDWPVSATSLAITALGETDHDAQLAFARRARAARPGDIDLQRAYLAAMDDAGRIDEARAELRKAVADRPDSELMRYLDAVSTEGVAGKDKLVALSATAKAPDALRSAVWRQWVCGENEAAARDWDALLARSPQDAVRVVDAKVGAELALGRPQRALDGLRRLAATEAGANDMQVASYYAMVARGAGADPTALFAKIDPRRGAVLFAYQAERAGPDIGRSLNGSEAADQPMPALARTLRIDAQMALNKLREVSATDIFWLEPEHWALLYGEAARRQDKAAMARLASSGGGFDRNELARITDYAGGKPVTLDDLDIDPQTRAALAFIRSRVAALPEAERASLRAAALAGDRLHSVISIAADAWKP